MGFGLLLFGYLMMFSVPFHGVDVFADFIGYAFMLRAFMKLEAYNAFFLRAKQTSVVMLGVSVVGFFVQVLDVFLEMPTVVTTVIYAVFTIGALVLHYFMLFGIKRIAAYTEDYKLVRKSERNWYLTVTYYLVLAILSFPPIEKIAGEYFGLPLYVFGLVWMLLNLLLIFSCYARICLEGDEDMPYTPNRLELWFDNLTKKNKKS